MLGPDPQLPYDYSGLSSQLRLYFSLLASDFSSTSPRLFSSLALVVLNFLSRKLTTFRVFPRGSSEVVGASLRKSEKVLELVSRPRAFRGRRYGSAMTRVRFLHGFFTVSSRFTPTNHAVSPRFSTVSTTNRIRDVTVSPRLSYGCLRTSHDLP